MNYTKFEETINEQIKRSTDVLVAKAPEYATEGDRLHNFNQAAALQGITPRQALAGFMAKHVISVYDMVMSDKDYPIELWNEKITDNINYLLLLAAVIRDNPIDDVTLYADDHPYMKA